MADTETDAGADAVALAIRDLTEEISKIRELLGLMSLPLCASGVKDLPPEHARWLGAKLGELAKRP